MVTSTTETTTVSGSVIDPSPTTVVKTTDSIWYNINTFLRDFGIMIGFVPVLMALLSSKDYVGLYKFVTSSDFTVAGGAFLSVGIVIWRQVKAWKTEAKVETK